jgi:hypothetical protein
MPRTSKLSDTQLILLAIACQRENGSLLPPPPTLADQGGRIRKSVTAIIKLGYAEEVPAPDPAQAWREDGERTHDIVITSAGRAAIAAEEPKPGESPVVQVVPASGPDAPAASAADLEPATPAAITLADPRTGTKQALVVALLRRDGGASLADLVGATGWLPHTTRAALTGLRKKGYMLAKDKVADVTHYRIAGA